MKKENKIAFGLIICIFLVSVLIGLAMAFYPIRYSWSKNFLSALGLTTVLPMSETKF